MARLRALLIENDWSLAELEARNRLQVMMVLPFGNYFAAEMVFRGNFRSTSELDLFACLENTRILTTIIFVNNNLTPVNLVRVYMVAAATSGSFKLLDAITLKKSSSLAHIEEQLRQLTISESRVILLYSNKGKRASALAGKSF